MCSLESRIREQLWLVSMSLTKAKLIGYKQLQNSLDSTIGGGMTLKATSVYYYHGAFIIMSVQLVPKVETVISSALLRTCYV